MTRSIVLATLVAFGGLTVGIAQEFRPVRPPLPDAVKIKDNLYVIGASTPGNDFTGGNTVILVTDSGVVLVDTKLSGYGAVILQKVKKVTDKPVTTIINTHTHGDHVGSNEGFPGSVDIVAQENTKANMAKMTAFQGANASFLPKRTFKDKLTIGSGNNRVDLYYFGPGHTNGDAFVVFPSVRVLQTGDMFAWRDAPVIDRTQGASGVEFPKTLAKALAAIKDVDVVIPGHSPATTLKDLAQYQKFTADFVSAVQSAIKAGKSAEEAAKTIDLTAQYPGYTKERYAPAIAALYEELKKS